MRIEHRQSSPEVNFPVTVLSISYISSLLCTCIIFWSLSAILLCLRLYTRAFIVKSLGWDDLAMCIAVILFGIFCGVVVALTIMFGFNPGYISESTLTLSTNLLIVVEVFYCLTIGAVKIALGLFFLRILIIPWQRRTVYVILVITTFFSLGYSGWAIFQCGVPGQGAAFWQKKIAGQCDRPIVNAGVGYTHAIMNALTDIALSLLPIPMIQKSKMRQREKRSVYFLLLLAAAGSIASIARIRWIYVLAIVDLSFWYEVKYFAIFSAIEPGLGIIAGCLVTLRPMYRSVRTHIYSYRSRGTTDQETGLSGTMVAEEEKKSIKYRLSVPFLLSQTRGDDTTVADTTINDTVFSKEENEDYSQAGDMTASRDNPAACTATEIQKEEKEEEMPKDLDQKTRRSIRSNRATWFMMPRSSISSVSEQNTLATDATQDNDDLSWFILQEPKVNA